MFKFDAYFSDIFGDFGEKNRGGGGLTPKGKSQNWPTLSFRVVG